MNGKKPIAFASAYSNVVVASPSSSDGGGSVRLNVKLHQQLIQQGRIRPSTRESAQIALERIRQKRGG